MLQAVASVVAQLATLSRACVVVEIGTNYEMQFKNQWTSCLYALVSVELLDEHYLFGGIQSCQTGGLLFLNTCRYKVGKYSEVQIMVSDQQLML